MELGEKLAHSWSGDGEKKYRGLLRIRGGRGDSWGCQQQDQECLPYLGLYGPGSTVVHAMGSG